MDITDTNLTDFPPPKSLSPISSVLPTSPKARTLTFVFILSAHMKTSFCNPDRQYSQPSHMHYPNMCSSITFITTLSQKIQILQIFLAVKIFRNNHRPAFLDCPTGFDVKKYSSLPITSWIFTFYRDIPLPYCKGIYHYIYKNIIIRLVCLPDASGYSCHFQRIWTAQYPQS